MVNVISGRFGYKEDLSNIVVAVSWPAAAKEYLRDRICPLKTECQRHQS